MSGLERPPLPVNSTDVDWHVHQHERGHWQIVKIDHGGSTRLNFGDNEEACRARFGEMTALGLCPECGGIRDIDYVEPTKARLLEIGLCFGCDHWTLLLKKRGQERIVIVDGRHYMIERDLLPGTPGHCAGYGGSKFVIRFHDGREVVSRNLWCQGNIPDHFRERLPDNAVFVREPRSPSTGDDG